MAGPHCRQVAALVGRGNPRPTNHNVPVIQPVELGLVKAEGDSFDVSCAVRIETNVTPANTFVVRACHAPMLLALGLVLITQRGIAHESGDLHENYVGAVERGERNLSLYNVWRLANGLGLLVADLVQDLPARKAKRATAS